MERHACATDLSMCDFPLRALHVVAVASVAKFCPNPRFVCRASVPSSIADLFGLPAMLCQKVDAVVGFLSSVKAMLPGNPAWSELVASQVRSIVDFAQTTPPSLEHATSALAALAGEKTAAIFDEAARASIASAITAAIQASGNAPVTSASQVVSRAACQAHFFMYNYLTSDDWNELLSQSIVNLKLKVVVNRGLAVGLSNPSEKTFVSILALVIVSSQSSLSSVEAHALLSDLKRLWRNLRISGTAKQSCAVFPPSSEDFMKACPGYYSDAAPPVVSRLSIALIEDVRTNLAARKTHKTLAAMGAQHQVVSLLKMLAPGGVVGAPGAPSPQPRLTIFSGGSSKVELLGLDDHTTQSPVVTPRGKAPLPFNDGSVSPAPVAQAALVALADAPEEPQTANNLPRQSDRAVASWSQPPPTLETIDGLVAEFQSVVDKQKPKVHGGSAKPKAKASAIMKRPASQCFGDPGVKVVENEAGAADAQQDPTPPGKKRLQGTLSSTVIRGAEKPFTTVEWSRSQVLARVGLRGPGMSKSFKFKEDPAEVKQAALEWLTHRCGELGVAFVS